MGAETAGRRPGRRPGPRVGWRAWAWAAAVAAAALGPAGGAGGGQGQAAELRCQACQVVNKWMQVNIHKQASHMARSLQMGQYATFNVDLRAIIQGLGQHKGFWEDPHARYRAGLREAVDRIAREHEAVIYGAWQGKNGTLEQAFEVHKAVCIDKLSVCPSLRTPLDRARTKCEMCREIVGDVDAVMSRINFTSTKQVRVMASRVLDDVCQLLPMRHDPAPIWKKNLNDLRHLCDDLLSEHDEDIIDAWAALGELENPATRVCRKVAKLCKKEKEKGAGQEL